MTRSQSTPQSSQIVWLEARVKELEGECAFDQRNAAASQRESAMLLDKCELLAQQVETMRSALVDTTEYLERTSNRWDGINGKHPATVVESARAALALPNILKKRDARVLREAAKKFAHGFRFELERMADELERKPPQDMTEADFNEAHVG